jgi:PhnB protein
MKKLEPYLTFAGNCREALNFYKDCFKGEITSIQTFGEGNMATEEALKDRILHAVFKAEDMSFMASDGMADFHANPGNMTSLTVELGDEQEQETIFNALAEGGKVTMPLERTFWGAKFGMLTDRYGIQWMLNCTLPGGSPA